MIDLSNSHKHIDHCGRLFSTLKGMCTFHDISVETYKSRRRLGYTLEQALTGSGIKRTPSIACKDHKGNEFPSVKAMCKYYGVNEPVYYARLKRGCTLEQALTGNGIKQTTSIVCKDHKDNEFPSVKDMCAYYGVDDSTYYARLNRGCTLEQALTGNGAKRTPSIACKDHKDNEFPSVKAMCEYYDVDDATYYDRLKRGCTLEQALTGSGIKRTPSIACKDHKDNEFPSVKAMCKYYGVGVFTYYVRLNQGYTLEQALMGNGVKRTTSVACKDHKDNEFPSVKAMCAYYGVDDSTYYARLNRGCTLEQALTGNGAKRTPSIACKDHEDNEFLSVKAMREHYGVSDVTYYDRLKRGYTLEQALTGNGVKRSASIACKDHKDNEFPSVKDMCEYYGVDDSTYYNRLKRGYTVEQALTGNGLKRSASIACKDHKDNEFPSVKTMCAYYGVDASVYRNRLKRGYTVEQALTGKGIKQDIRYKYYDHEGNGFTSLEGMCVYHGVTVYSYQTRLKQGYTLEQALLCDVEFRTDHKGRVFDTIDAMCKHYNTVRETYYSRLQKGYTKEQALTGEKPNKNN